MSEPQDQAQLYQQIIAKCWADDSFKQRLLSDPTATLKAEGVEIPEDLSVKVLENTPEIFHMVIPAKTTELSNDELDGVQGGNLWFDLASIITGLPCK